MMLTEYKNRTLTAGQRVKVYFNLQKKVFSIADQQSNLVLAHGDNFFLKWPSFKVNEAGRQQVIATGVKNVHAFILGEFKPLTVCDNIMLIRQITYNPYRHEYFFLKESEIPVTEGLHALFYKGKVYLQ